MIYIIIYLQCSLSREAKASHVITKALAMSSSRLKPTSLTVCLIGAPSLTSLKLHFFINKLGVNLLVVWM